MASKRTFGNVGGFDITAPPQTYFAFNPWYFEFTRYSSTADRAARIAFGTGDSREPYNGAARADLQRWVQRRFADVEDELKWLRYVGVDIGATPFVKEVDVGTITVYDSAGSVLGSVSPAIWYAVWGTIGRGEGYGYDETLRWFQNWPFTIDVNSRSTVDWGGGYGYTAVDGARLLRPAAVYPLDHVTRRVTVEDAQQALDQEEDVDTQVITLVPDCTPADAENRVYLRWVDSLGRLRYWLFYRTGQTEAVGAESWNRAETPEPDIYDEYVSDPLPQRQSLTATRTVALGAPSLSESEYALVLSLASSPIVDEFDGYDSYGDALWHRVGVVAGSLTRDRARMQDITLSITESTRQTQTL